MTDHPGTTEERRLRAAVGSTAERLQDAYLGHKDQRARAEARAVLARLRTNSSRAVTDNPLGLQQTLMILRPQLSENEIGKTDAASPEEWAAYQALALFGRHMQSARKPVHTKQQSFAWACGRLVAVSDSNSVKPRFDAMQLSATEEARAAHLRSLVDLLKVRDLGFDYGRFALDLRDLVLPKRKNSVLLRWGREFSRGFTHSPHSTTTTAKDL